MSYSNHLKKCWGNPAEVQAGSLGQQFCLRISKGELLNRSVVLGAEHSSALHWPTESGSTNSTKIDRCDRHHSWWEPDSQDSLSILCAGHWEPQTELWVKGYLSLSSNCFVPGITVTPGYYIHLSFLQSQEFSCPIFIFLGMRIFAVWCAYMHACAYVHKSKAVGCLLTQPKYLY